MQLPNATFVLSTTGAAERARSAEGLRVVVNPAQRFGEALREYRRVAELTQEELAERAGISPRSISGLERGEGAIPRRDTVALLTRALGLTGADRENFEALVLRPRRPRAVIAPKRVATPSTQPAEHSAHHLPRALDSFVGREQDMSDLGPALLSAPLITLVGPGGVGKTRLAHELARSQGGRFSDGAVVVELGELTDPSLVSCAVATATGVGDFCGRNTAQFLVDFLRPKHMLLVVDNCEHLVGACAELLATLLRHCPDLHVLATSREALAINGEMVWFVRPLALPDPTRVQTASLITRRPAARLFVERARAANSLFVATDANAAAIARVCVALDGVPLALELAAARMRLMTVEQLSERLERDLHILRGSSRGASARHETMRATIDWSHDLLEGREQILLRRLAVFAGGWTLDMAEDVCEGQDIERAEVLHLLAQLVDKSMVQVTPSHGVARYRLLGPIRQYAFERLEECGEAAEYLARHAATTLSLPRPSQGHDFGPDEVASLDRFEAEHANLRAALRWALAHGDSDAALRAASALFRFWERRGHLQEGAAWLEEALAAAVEAPSRYRGPALNALAFLYWRSGELERALPIAEQGLAINRETGTPLGVAFALGNLGAIASLRDEPELAVARLKESVALGRETGYRPFVSVAQTLLARSLVRLHGPGDEEAAMLLEDSLGLAEAALSRYAQAQALLGLGDLHWWRGASNDAIVFWSRALTVWSELADPRGVAGAIERLARGLAARGDFEPAARLFGAADAHHRVLGIEVRRNVEVGGEELLAATRAHLGEAFAAAWEGGQAFTLDQAVHLVQSAAG